MVKLKKGQKVFWKSQGRGRWKSKTGHVVLIVGANKDCPNRKYLEEMFEGCTAEYIEGALPRDHESYIVKVLGRTPQSRARLYWPRVSKLEILP